MTKPKTPAENKLFPGRPNYTGPSAGYFAMLHHTILFEHSHHVMERIRYVQVNKSLREQPVRLRNMIYLGDCPEVATYTKLKNFREEISEFFNSKLSYETRYLFSGAMDELEGRLHYAVLTYIKQVYPKHAWNGTKVRGTKD